MLVIPAIDVSAGRLVRWEAGAIVPVEAFDGDPVAAARALIGEGARWLHFVDVDLAMRGGLRNVALLSQVADLGVRVQASGGVATGVEIGALLAAGASRVVMGSRALDDVAAAMRLVAAHGEGLAVGLECEGNVIRPRGGGAGGGTIEELVPALLSAGARRFIHTNVTRSGSLAGSDLASLKTLLEIAGVPVVVSGGVSSLDELRELAALDPGPEAAILGRALYDGALRLSEATRAAEE